VVQIDSGRVIERPSEDNSAPGCSVNCIPRGQFTSDARLCHAGLKQLYETYSHSSSPLDSRFSGPRRRRPQCQRPCLQTQRPAAGWLLLGPAEDEDHEPATTPDQTTPHREQHRGRLSNSLAQRTRWRGRAASPIRQSSRCRHQSRVPSKLTDPRIQTRIRATIDVCKHPNLNGLEATRPTTHRKNNAAGQLLRRIDSGRIVTDDMGRKVPAGLTISAPIHGLSTELEGSKLTHGLSFTDAEFISDGLKQQTTPRSSSN